MKVKDGRDSAAGYCWTGSSVALLFLRTADQRRNKTGSAWWSGTGAFSSSEITF